MWQIHIASGNVKEVFGESSDLIHLISMKVKIGSFAYRLNV